jgi:hypothetical protein
MHVSSNSAAPSRLNFYTRSSITLESSSSVKPTMWNYLASEVCQRSPKRKGERGLFVLRSNCQSVGRCTCVELPNSAEGAKGALRETRVLWTKIRTKITGPESPGSCCNVHQQCRDSGTESNFSCDSLAPIFIESKLSRFSQLKCIRYHASNICALAFHFWKEAAMGAGKQQTPFNQLKYL